VLVDDGEEVEELTLEASLYHDLETSCAIVKLDVAHVSARSGHGISENEIKPPTGVCRQHLLDGGEQLPQGERFHEKPKRQRLELLGSFEVAGYQDGRDALGGKMLSEGTALLAEHDAVDQAQVYASAVRDTLPRLGCVARNLNVETERLQRVCERIPNVGVIVDHEDALAIQHGSGPRALPEIKG
jgi:hypothetical protein